MKKFLNTMLVTAAVVAASTAAYADAGAKPAQGAYIAASAGVANTNVKYNRVASGNMSTNGAVATATLPAETEVFNANVGKTAGIFGALAGYNLQSGSVVFGGEIYGGLDSTKVIAYDDTGSGNSTERSVIGSVTVKRTNFFGFAPRLGFMIAPNTLMYARLGVEFGKWKATSNPNLNALSANGVTTTASATDLANSKAVTSASKGGMSFAPGLGMEVYMGKAFIRAQYSYLFGPKVNLVQNMKAFPSTSSYFNGDYANHTMKMSQHKVELAVGYKF